MAKKRTVDLSKAATGKQGKREHPEIVRDSDNPSPTPSPGTTYTAKGYVTTEGVKKYRVSIHLTKEQRSRLRELAEDDEKTVTDYIISQLGL